jgi:hypothetical protein
MNSKLLIFWLFLFAFKAQAAVQVGTGFNSATSGRLVPALHLGVGSDSFETLFTSTGVSTTAYYHSAYKLSAYWTWKAGDFLVGHVEAGFGAGGLYAVRSFKDSTSAEETKSDYVLGPAFFARWVFWDPAFVAVDSLYGLFGPSNRYGDLLGLNARDNVSFIIGIRL